MYNIFWGNIAGAATFLSIACRFILMLGAHLDPADHGLTESATTDTWRSRRYLRRLFWLCYVFDKDICLRAGYPPLIDDDHCDLTIPQGYEKIDNLGNSDDGSSCVPGDIRLTIVKSRAIKLLCCAKAFRKSDVELLKDIRELDQVLEEWRISIPLSYRPTLAPSYRLHLDPGNTKAKNLHLIYIHLEYYFLLALIHSASGRCSAWAISETEKKTNLTSSQTLALQASRSTLVTMLTMKQFWNNVDFWLVAQWMNKFDV